MHTGLRQERDLESTPATTVASREELRGTARRKVLAARLEPFDSYWQAPRDVEKGYTSFFQYYKHNYLPHMPLSKAAKVLVVSCGPGYLVNMLRDAGYENVLGIDSDPEKIAFAVRRGLNCNTATAFEYLDSCSETFDCIIPEQELNHLTLDEQLDFLALCRHRLRDGGRIFVYGLNGANPLVGSENLAHNIDHFNTFTEHSLRQTLELSGFEDVELLPLDIYVFWKNPMNYVGLAITSALELGFRLVYKMYGKNVRILSKKLAAVAVKRDGETLRAER